MNHGPSELDTATDRELLDALLRRPNFLGVVIHREKVGKEHQHWVVEVGTRVRESELPTILECALSTAKESVCDR